jgi:hypothetical protein
MKNRDAAAPVLVHIPRALRQRLRLAAIQAESNMSQLVAAAVEMWLNSQGEGGDV